MKKVLFSAIALTALALTGCSTFKDDKKGYITLTDKCELQCNKQGKRVDFQYSEETGTCRCSSSVRG